MGLPLSQSVKTIISQMMNGKVHEPVISSAIGVTSATGVTEAVSIPAGAYVYRVGLMATSAVATADLDVGDGTVTDRFIDGVTTMTANDIKFGGLGGSVSADPVGGHYYSSADTIDLNVVGTGGSGTVKVLAWYFML